MKKFAKIMALVMIVAMSMTLLVSCAPNSNPDKALDALHKNNYVSAKDPIVIPMALSGMGVKGIDTVIKATKKVDGKVDHVTIVYFESAAAASDAWDLVNKYVAEEDESDKKNDWTINKSGAMIYYGTSAAIKAAR